MTQILHKPHLCTTLDIWMPKYNTESGDWEVWISQRKVAYSSPLIIINFVKAKHLQGQRFCVRRQDIERSPVGTNGKIPVYKVPFYKLDSWQTAQEVMEIAETVWGN